MKKEGGDRGNQEEEREETKSKRVEEEGAEGTGEKEAVERRRRRRAERHNVRINQGKRRKRCGDFLRSFPKCPPITAKLGDGKDGRLGAQMKLSPSRPPRCGSSEFRSA